MVVKVTYMLHRRHSNSSHVMLDVSLTVVGSKSGGKCVMILLAVLIGIICVSVAIMEWNAAFQNWICEMYDVRTPEIGRAHV